MPSVAGKLSSGLLMENSFCNKSFEKASEILYNGIIESEVAAKKRITLRRKDLKIRENTTFYRELPLL